MDYPAIRKGQIVLADITDDADWLQADCHTIRHARLRLSRNDRTRFRQIKTDPRTLLAYQNIVKYTQLSLDRFTALKPATLQHACLKLRDERTRCAQDIFLESKDAADKLASFLKANEAVV
jgi:hypothetical protein